MRVFFSLFPKQLFLAVANDTDVANDSAATKACWNWHKHLKATVPCCELTAVRWATTVCCKSSLWDQCRCSRTCFQHERLSSMSGRLIHLICINASRVLWWEGKPLNMWISEECWAEIKIISSSDEGDRQKNRQTERQNNVLKGVSVHDFAWMGIMFQFVCCHIFLYLTLLIWLPVSSFVVNAV